MLRLKYLDCSGYMRKESKESLAAKIEKKLGTRLKKDSQNYETYPEQSKHLNWLGP